MKPTTCFAPAHILLPSEQVPLEQWGCIACDQFTSDRSYWQRAEETAAGAPSTLNLILPEGKGGSVLLHKYPTLVHTACIAQPEELADTDTPAALAQLEALVQEKG